MELKDPAGEAVVASKPHQEVLNIQMHHNHRREEAEVAD
tara:strand:- start:920 stop:1036 length:117 start_codon:yes stop_codon:yes gene_type:complete